MIVSMWMTRDVVTAVPEVPISEAAALMARKGVRRLPIVSGEGHDVFLLGIVSATDILRAYPPDVNPFAVETPDAGLSTHTVGEIMKRNLVTTTIETPIEDAAILMCERKISGLPVLRNEKLAGIITESDIFRAFASLFTAEGHGARITFDASKGEDVFTLIAQFAQRDRVHVDSLITTEQDNRPVCIVRVSGPRVDKMLDDLWRSGHLVLSVLRS